MNSHDARLGRLERLEQPPERPAIRIIPASLPPAQRGAWCHRQGDARAVFIFKGVPRTGKVA